MARVEHPLTPIQTGGVDWAAHWRRMVEERAAVEGARTPPSANRWDGRAQRFARLTQSLDPSSDPFVLAVKAAVKPTDSVLDVGAGAGRYAFAIAPLVAQVTAVEPSGGMRAAFEQEAKARGLDNVRLVPGSWDEAQVEPHDVAFVANVLYFVPDAIPFVEKLDRSGTRACFIFHRVEELATALGPLGVEIRGRRPPEASFIELYNLLFSMGIRPDVTLVRPPFSARYGSMDEGVEEAHQFLDIPADDRSQDDRIRGVLSEVLVERDGQLGFARSPQMAILSWEK